jgi:class 3 adenylate cyclase/CHASE2 domain-containing sensor protein
MIHRYPVRLPIAVFGIAVFTWLVVAHGPLRTLENWLGDLQIAMVTPRQIPPDDLVLLTITEDTLRRFSYRSPINRLFLAQLVTTLDQKGVRAIGLDILLDQPTEPLADKALLEALRGSTVPVIVAYADQEHLDPWQQAFLERYTAGLNRGYANLLLDNADGVVRSIFAGRIAPNGQFIPGLAFALVGVTPPSRPVPLRYRGLALGASEDNLIGAFKTYPAHLVEALPVDWLAGRIVLIGADLQESSYDMSETPFAALLGHQKGRLPGVFIHAHAVAQLLGNRSLPVTPPWIVFGIYFTAALVGAVLAQLDESIWVEIGLVILLLAGLGVLAFAWYSHGGSLLPLGGPALALLLAAGWCHADASRRERRQKRFIQSAFARYLHPDWVAQLTAKPELLQLQGERRELTVLFTDVAGFTAISEELPSDTLVWVLSRYLQGMTDIIVAHGGAVNKYLGDGIMVLFGAPLAQNDHALRAVRCALALDRFAEAFRCQACDSNGQPVAFGQTRIGIHTGEAVVGNFGSQARLEYTAIGDVVNTASRLEGLNRYLGTRIVLSDATRRQLQEQPDADDLCFQPVGRILVKGKQQALQVFHPLVVDSEATKKRIADYLRAYALLETGDHQALQRFAELRACYPNDALVQYYESRLRKGKYNSQITLSNK